MPTIFSTLEKNIQLLGRKSSWRGVFFIKKSVFLKYSREIINYLFATTTTTVLASFDVDDIGCKAHVCILCTHWDYGTRGSHGEAMRMEEQQLKVVSHCAIYYVYYHIVIHCVPEQVAMASNCMSMAWIRWTIFFLFLLTFCYHIYSL
jgi:hypothetical protein